MDIVLYVLSALSIVGTFLPFHQSDHWIVRGQDNFKIFYLFTSFILLILGYLQWDNTSYKSLILFLLLISIITCFIFIIPFTRFYPNTEIKKAHQLIANNQLSILIFNVYQYNDQYQKLIDKVQELKPDILLLLETSDKWYQALLSLKESFPYEVKEIRDDTYGILCLSKIPFIESKVNHWVLENVPSVEMLIKVSNQNIRIIGLHPKPPVPTEKTYSTSKDKEIMRTARYINECPSDEAQLLIGDLNEVAWCRTSREFKKLTSMKDLRIGRGYFGTFPAYSPIRFPLDHVYASSHFELVDFKTIDKLGSDHLALHVTFQLKVQE